MRLLGQEADSLAPGTPVNLAYSGALHGAGALDAFRRADAAGKQYVGHAGVTLGDYLPYPLPEDLEEAVTRWGKLRLPAVVCPLEVGAAALHPEGMERVLTMLFSQPWVAGIYFGEPTAAGAGDPTAALFDDAGAMTAAGATVDALFGTRWWTDERVTADVAGHARARVFFGRHRVTVELADGAVFETTLWVGRGADARRTVVLQPVGEAAAESEE